VHGRPPRFIPTSVYLLCLITAAACAWLLGRSYRRVGARLLLWSALCFALLAVNNLVMVIDLLVRPNADLRMPRTVVALAAVGVLLFGFVWDTEER
jgi:hypothetical protein